MNGRALFWLLLLVPFTACERAANHPDIFAGSKPRVVASGKPAAFIDAAYRVEWSGVNVPRSVKRATRIDIEATVTNVTPVPWPDRDANGKAGPGAVTMGLSWTRTDDPAQKKFYALDRGELPQALLPGESARLRLNTKAPAAPGKYYLDLDMVHEGVTWFAWKVNTPARSEVIVE